MRHLPLGAHAALVHFHGQDQYGVSILGPASSTKNLLASTWPVSRRLILAYKIIHDSHALPQVDLFEAPVDRNLQVFVEVTIL